MAVVAFIVGVVFSLGASALVVTMLERLGARFGAARGKTVALWYGGLTLIALGLALRGGGLDRREGGLIVGLYLAFVALLIVSQRFPGFYPSSGPGASRRTTLRSSARAPAP